MPIMTVERLLSILSNHSKEDSIWVVMYDKDDVKHTIEQYEWNDENDNPFDLDEVVTDDFFEKVFTGVNDDEIWGEQFYESYKDCVMNTLYEDVKETYNQKTKEVLQEEIEQSLWDTEQENTNGNNATNS